MNAIVALKKAKNYTDQSLNGAGALKGDKGDKGDKGNDGIGISQINKIGTSGLIDIYQIVFTDGNTYNFTIKNGADGIKGDKGDKGDQGIQGINGIDGKDGITYIPQIGTITMLPPGSTASATINLDTINNIATFNFSIPKGDLGKDGITPHIDTATNHWMIGTVDTGINATGAKGTDGRSIKSLKKSDDDDIIVTFSDDTIQNIGKLKIDVQADFLTSDGFGKLRYYNGKFQYYDEDILQWIETSVSPQNVYIMNMMPQEMQFILGIYDTDLKKYKLKWKEPKDTVIDGQVACVIEKIIIRRKLGSVPQDENDGDLVLEIKRSDFGSYQNSWFVDYDITPNIGDKYYYKAFPVSTTGFYNSSTQNETGCIEAKDYYLYGYRIDQSESDPDSMIRYIEDNKKFHSAYMNYTKDKFDYGDWNDTFFMQVKPCMLKYDGTVDYYLNQDNYGLKEDGTPSDITNEYYEGNAMIQFPKIYWKIIDNGDNTADIYISNKKLDNNFVCWSHIDNNGNEIDYCYMPIYNGSYYNGALRSLSDKTPLHSDTAQNEISYANANNKTNDIIWYTEVYCDRILINLLLLLIGKSTDTQSIFGNGHYSGGKGVSSIIHTGTMNQKGLFYGTNSINSGVKVFGIEHWWGNQWRRIAGLINDKGTQKIKMTYGTSDGSAVHGYNLDGNGYITTDAVFNGVSGGYIDKMKFTKNGMISISANGSATTYYCDGYWLNNTKLTYGFVGGGSEDPNCFLVGAFLVDLTSIATFGKWQTNASISCKPIGRKA